MFERTVYKELWISNFRIFNLFYMFFSILIPTILVNRHMLGLIPSIPFFIGAVIFFIVSVKDKFYIKLDDFSLVACLIGFLYNLFLLYAWGVNRVFATTDRDRSIVVIIGIIVYLIGILILILEGNKLKEKEKKKPSGKSEALDILNVRYSKGEINKEKYDQIKKDIEGK